MVVLDYLQGKPNSTVESSNENPSSSHLLRANSSVSGLIPTVESVVIMNIATAMVPRASTSHITVSHFLPHSAFNQTTNYESFLTMAMSKFVAFEEKVWKINKKKLKTVLTVIDSMNDEELGEVGSVPKPSQLASPQTNSGTSKSPSLLLCSGPLRSSPLSYSSDTTYFAILFSWT